MNWAAEQRQRYALRRRILRDFLLRPIGFTLLVKPHVTGLENVPASGGTILMMNHHVGIDAPVITGIILNRYPIPLVKIESMYARDFVGFLARNWGCFGIQRGEVDREALKTALELLEMGEMLVIAPEGTRHKELQQPKDGLAYLALKANPIIVPVGLSNAETWASDIVKPWKRTHMYINFGKPFRIRGAGEKRLPRGHISQITDELMYQLAAALPESYRGEYADFSKMTTEYLEFLK